MKKKLVALTVFFLLLTMLSCNKYILDGSGSYDKISCIPDEKTARKIGSIILRNKYGSDKVLKPLYARIENREYGEVWIIRLGKKTGSKLVRGGPYLEIKKSDCQLIKVSYGK